MSTENAADAQLVDYDEEEEIMVNEMPNQQEENVDTRK